MDKQLILFGSGEFGTEAFSFFGDEAVACFCDNDSDMVGAVKCGKPIISFVELKQKYSNDAIVVISANRLNSDAIVRQCEENDIPDYLVYERIRTAFENGKKALDFIGKPSNRMQMKLELYQDKVRELRQEIGYFKHHADIRGMKPATGKIRERQLRTARVSAELFQKLDELRMTPYLTGGNLLGYLRHGGFIPWDDDIDFDLIRDEFERFKAYCMTHMYSEQEYKDREKGRTEKQVEKGFEKYYWVDWIHHFQVNVTFPDGDSIGVDFFPIDYYGEDCGFDEYLEFVKETKQEWELAADSHEKRLICMEKAKEKNKKYVVRESSHVYFGVDNLANFRSYHKGEWIPRDVVFPLKQVLYEGELFWVPNKVDEYVSYQFKTVWEFPGDNIAIPKHYHRHKMMENNGDAM